jgi:glycosyltransferase involved in cell wall biosynthesis
MKSRKLKLLVVSHAFAPYASGSAILMANLLEEFPGECRAIRGYSRYMVEDKEFSPPCPTEYIGPLKGKIFKLGYARFINSNRWYVRFRINRIVKEFKPDIILGAFPHSTFFIAAYEVAKKHSIPFYAHMHDLWQENYPDGYYAKKLADKYEETILKTAARVFCMTDTQAKHYIDKYKINPYLLPHTIPGKNLKELHYREVHGNEYKVMFAGGLSKVMNADALAVFSHAKKHIKQPVIFNLFTNASESDLLSYSVDVSAVNIKWVSRKEVMEEQRSSKILFAPLSHKHGSDLEVKTVFSTKLLEYLVSGRPILMFAPPDSFHSISARKNNWGLVIDNDDPELLAKGIERLLTDEVLARELVEGAFKEARERNSQRYAQQLYNYMEEDISKGKSISSSS